MLPLDLSRNSAAPLKILFLGAHADDIEIDPAMDADAFIEEQEEGEDDVADIIGDVEKEDEA